MQSARKTKTGIAGYYHMAESEGFEPSIRFPVYTLSRRAPSTTRTTLQVEKMVIMKLDSLFKGLR